MPLYDWECPHGHVFEHIVPMDDRDKPIPCEGRVNQLLTDDEVAAVEAGTGPSDVVWVEVFDHSRVAARPVPCILKAKRIISHSNPAGLLDHGLARNRDNAREGRYDPLRPATNVMSKGRNWRK